MVKLADKNNQKLTQMLLKVTLLLLSGGANIVDHIQSIQLIILPNTIN